MQVRQHADGSVFRGRIQLKAPSDTQTKEYRFGIAGYLAVVFLDDKDDELELSDTDRAYLTQEVLALADQNYNETQARLRAVWADGPNASITEEVEFLDEMGGLIYPKGTRIRSSTVSLRCVFEFRGVFYGRELYDEVVMDSEKEQEARALLLEETNDEDDGWDDEE